jgi:mono/diheme cytochrome c family protein
VEEFVPRSIRNFVCMSSVIALFTLCTASITVPLSAAAGPDGRELYLDRCATCHGPDGAGKNARGKRLKVRDVRDTVKTVTAAQMADIVRKGKEPDMPGYAKEFSDEQVQAVIEHYRGLAKDTGTAK